MMNRKIAAQLYTVRDFCQNEADFNMTLAKLKNIGYQAIQVSGVGPIPAKTIRAIADQNGMEIYCTHRGFQEYTDDLEGVIQYHKDLGCSVAGLGCAPTEYLQDADGLCALLKIFNDVSAALAANGLTFAYHNHAFEFSKLDGKWVMDYLLEETDPSSFGFIPDVYWMAYAGVNPPDYLKKLGSRAKVVVSIHLYES